MVCMNQILCKIIGHRDFSPEVLRIRPWESPDFQALPISDFRELHCLRCGESLRDDAEAA
jgi:hypothetical protein